MNVLVILLLAVVVVLIGAGAVIGGAALFGLIALAALVMIGWFLWAVVFHGREIAEHVREMPTGDATHLGPVDTADPGTAEPDAETDEGGRRVA